MFNPQNPHKESQVGVGAQSHWGAGDIWVPQACGPVGLVISRPVRTYLEKMVDGS